MRNEYLSCMEPKPIIEPMDERKSSNCSQFRLFFDRASDKRPITVETGVIPTAVGSARVRMSSTDVIVGVKAEICGETVGSSSRISFAVNCSPHASYLLEGLFGLKMNRKILMFFVAGKDERTMRDEREKLAEFVTVMLTQCYANAVAIDWSKLELTKRTRWMLAVDVDILEGDGNVIDVVALAVSRKT